MRDVYAHQVIKSDFVLVMGDVVSNVRIDEVVREHKTRRKTNKDALMSIVLKEAGSAHRTRCGFFPFPALISSQLTLEMRIVEVRLR